MVFISDYFSVLLENNYLGLYRCDFNSQSASKSISEDLKIKIIKMLPIKHIDYMCSYFCSTHGYIASPAIEKKV